MKNLNHRMISKTTSRIAAVIVMALGLVALSPQRVWAAPIDIAITPPVAYLKVEPGQSITHLITVENGAPTAIAVEYSFVPFTVDEETGRPVLGDENPPKWVYLEGNPKNLEVAASSKQNIAVNLAPPSTTLTKEYHLSLLLKARPIGTGAGNDSVSTQVTGGIVSHLIVNVGSREADAPQLSLKKLMAPYLSDSLQPLKFQLSLANEGRQATAASGSAKVLDWRSQEVARYEFYPDMILSQTHRPARTWDDAANDPLETLSSQFVLKKPFLLGWYRVVIDIPNESGNQNVVVSHPIIVAPFSFLIVIFISWLIYYSSSWLIRVLNKKQTLQKPEKTSTLN